MAILEEISLFLQQGRAKNVKKLVEQALEEGLSPQTILEEGLGALVFVTREMLKKSGAVMDETEGLSQELRSIAGVEYAAVLKEYGDETIRVSLRAKTKGDVSKIAQRLGGGGHTKAAGCTINAPMTEAVDMVKQQLTTAIREL